jgi:hypothetical protein
MQMGEWVRFPDGGLVNFIDAQTPGSATTRAGLRVVRSTDNGRTFGSLERVGVLDGVEYGYAFDHVTEDGTTWLLLMSFSNLVGGRITHPARPHAGQVSVIRTDDSGRTWRLVRDLSREFGDAPLNESALLRHGDGWIVSTRGYDNHQRLHLLDRDFRLQRQVDLTAKYPTLLNGPIGRPRLFARGGQVYLLGRHHPVPTSAGARASMQLALFRLDLAAPGIAACAILDNAENTEVTDGYYAMGWFRGAGAETVLHLITYQGIARRPPDLVHLAFRWNDVK